MRISEWSSEGCSSDLGRQLDRGAAAQARAPGRGVPRDGGHRRQPAARAAAQRRHAAGAADVGVFAARFAAGCGAGADRYGQGQRRIARRGAPALAGKWLIRKKFWTVRVRNGRVAAAAGACRSSHFQAWRSEEHTSELQSLLRISYAVFCLKKKKKTIHE